MTTLVPRQRNSKGRPSPQVAKEPTSETFAIIRIQGTHIIARDTYIIFGGFLTFDHIYPNSLISL
jgi:hypothetical protein